MFSTAETAEVYTLSLHDALPISRALGGARRRWAWASSPRKTPRSRRRSSLSRGCSGSRDRSGGAWCCSTRERSEEHTSELQSLRHLVCRPLLEKKKSG